MPCLLSSEYPHDCSVMLVSPTLLFLLSTINRYTRIPNAKTPRGTPTPAPMAVESDESEDGDVSAEVVGGAVGEVVGEDVGEDVGEVVEVDPLVGVNVVDTPNVLVSENKTGPILAATPPNASGHA